MFVSGVFLILISSNSSSRAQCTSYSVTIVSGPQCQVLNAYARVKGINEAGALCGSYRDCAEVSHPVIWWPNGSITEIATSARGAEPIPQDINQVGQVAGKMSVPNLVPPDRAFRFSNGITTNLGTLSGDTWSEATAINESGDVCGNSINPATGPLRAFVWLDGSMSALNLPLGPNSEAYGISDDGKICGWMGSDPTVSGHAYIYDVANRSTIDVGAPLPRTTNAEARGISRNGIVICGWSSIPCGLHCLERKSFVWSNGVAEDLGLLPGLAETYAFAVNDSKVVVGSCETGSGAGAFVWQNGVIQKLNDLIPLNSQLNIRIAWSINNSGQIAANARRTDGSGDDVGVRLTPIPATPGDFNCDRVVNTADLLGVINHWGMIGNPADFNHDGTVNAADLMVVIQNWTQ